MNVLPDPHRGDRAFDDQSSTLRESCAAYLQGTLDTAEARELESKLSDPAVAAVLQSEADFLLQWSSVLSSDPQNSTSSTASVSQRGVSSASKAAMIVAALAATLLAAITLRPSPAESFELRLARTWAEPSMDWYEGAEWGESELTADAVVLEDLDGVEELAEETSEWLAADASLQWMVAAVEPTIVNGEDNDG